MTEPRVLTFDISGNIGWAFGFPSMKRPQWGSWPIGDDWGARSEVWKHKFFKFVLGLIDEYKPTVIAYEAYFTVLAAFSPVMNEISIGLSTVIELAALERGITAIYKVDNRHWHKLFTGKLRDTEYRKKAKHVRRDDNKKASKDAAVARGWYITNDDEADALGIMVYVLVQLDPLYASRQGPLFRRAEMQADREAMVK